MNIRPIKPIVFGIVIVILTSNLLAQDSSITAADKAQNGTYFVASKAVEEARVSRDSRTLMSGLKNPALNIVTQSVDAITELGIQDAVPSLVAAWIDNQDARTGGTGSRIFQGELDQKLTLTLVKLTGQSADLTKPFTKPQMQQIVQSSKDWARQHNMNVAQ